MTNLLCRDHVVLAMTIKYQIKRYVIFQILTWEEKIKFEHNKLSGQLLSTRCDYGYFPGLQGCQHVEFVGFIEFAWYEIATGLDLFNLQEAGGSRLRL